MRNYTLALLVCIAVVAACDSANFGSSSKKKDTSGDGGDGGDGGKDAKDAPKDAGKSGAKDDAKDGTPDDGGDDFADGKPVDPNKDGGDADGGADTADSGSPLEIFENADGNRRESFAFGGDAKSPLVDVLFIMDNSVSMKDIVNDTTKGFESIAKDKVFPDRARVAVMTTMVSERGDFTKTHPGIAKYAGIEKEPGFLDFVDKKAIEDFRAVVGAGIKAKYDLDGCDDKWFKPTDVNAGGKSCISAHTQSAYHGVGCEPGATALLQLFQKNKGKTLFRNGAVLNVVYLSDTHDPGCDHADLRGDKRPTADQLKAALAEVDNTMAGFRIHALAPDKNCTGEEMHDKFYYGLADATKGIKRHPCGLTDYAPMMKELAEATAAPEKAVFTTSKKIGEIISVKVDGKETKDYKVNAAKDTVTIENLDPAANVKVEITYKPA